MINKGIKARWVVLAAQPFSFLYFDLAVYLIVV
jgi:hypothetical protein